MMRLRYFFFVGEAWRVQLFPLIIWIIFVNYSSQAFIWVLRKTYLSSFMYVANVCRCRRF